MGLALSSGRTVPNGGKLHIHKIEVHADGLPLDVDGLAELLDLRDKCVLGNGTLALSLTYFAVAIPSLGDLYPALWTALKIIREDAFHGSDWPGQIRSD